MTKSPIPTPEEALALQQIIPPGPPPPTPAGNGFAAWAADPQNSQKVINSLVPPGQSIMPAPPPPPAPNTPANPTPNPMAGPMAPAPWTPPGQLASAPPVSAAPMPTASAIMPPSMQGEAPATSPLLPPGAASQAPGTIPQIQSYKDWSAANPNMLDRASLKGRGIGRVLGGIGVAALTGAAGGMKGNPTAGLDWVSQQVQHDQNLPTINQGRYNAAVVAPAQAQLALQDTQSQIAQRNAAAAKSTAQAGAIGDDTKGKAKAVTDAAKLGMVPVYDEQGNLASFAPDEKSPIAQRRALQDQLTSAQVDSTKAQKELRDAQAEVSKAKGDPNSIENKLAMSRLAVARQNASTASQRLNLSTQTFMMRSRGTDMQGNPLPGAMIGDDDQAIGSAFQQNVRPTGTERNKGDMAASADEQLHDIKSIMQKHKDMFGPGYGQSSQFRQWIGSQDPDAQRFVAARTIAADHLAGTFGGRSEAALTALDNAIGQFKDNPTAAIAGVDQLTKANKRFENAGTVRTQGSNFNKQEGGSAMANPPNKGGDSLPPQAAAQLTEGVGHTFNNGQTWTKKNGVPVRVQ